MPHALLIYPEQPPAYWGARYALELLGQKAAFPPLGLLTIAAMFPPEYDLRVVDMNATSLREADLEWADVAFTSTMIVQRVSLQAVIERCRRAGLPVVAGGPYPTTYHEEIEGVDHFVLDEAEEVFPEFLRDLENGTARAIYRESRKPDVSRAPVPRFDLIDMKAYHSMCLQFSRGCPFDCEFCDITKLYGRVPRTKSPAQMLNEFEAVYRLGWRGPLFLVDDNFIGNKREACRLLPVVAEWQKAHGYPFSVITEASVNLARTDSLMDLMIDAGFDAVFLGIESPNPQALLKVKKPQNVDRREPDYLLHAVRKIQGKGMQVQGGFILGLDEDGVDAFDAQIDYIQEAGIPMAAIYLLTALKNTNLYERLYRENRLRDVPIGTVATAVNFKPQMELKTLIDGYRRVMTTLYDPPLENYFRRCLTLFEHLRPVSHLRKPMSRQALFLALMGIRKRLSGEQLPAFNRFMARVSEAHPRMLPEAIRLAALGYHFERVTRQQMAIHEFREFLAAELSLFKEAPSHSVEPVDAINERREELLTRVHARYRSIPGDYRYDGDEIEPELETFRFAVDEHVERLTHHG